METHFRAFKTEFTRAYSNWTASGANDPDNFEDYTNGNIMLLYEFIVISRDLTKFSPLFSSELQGDITFDSSATKSEPVKKEPGTNGSRPKKMKKKKKHPLRTWTPFSNESWP